MTDDTKIPSIIQSKVDEKPIHEGTESEKYLREIRNVAVTILVIICVSILGGVITGIAVAAHSHAIACQNNSFGC